MSVHGGDRGDRSQAVEGLLVKVGKVDNQKAISAMHGDGRRRPTVR